MKLRENKNLVWSSDAQQDYYFGMDKDELINEIESMGEVEDFLRIRGYDDIEEADEDELRSFLLPNDIDLDYEDFTESVMPMIKEQCANDVLVLWGKAANWRGAYDAGAVIDIDEFKKYIYPDYDAISEIYSDNGNLYYTQSSHDTPMGGTAMYLYSFKDNEAYKNACHLCDEKDDDGSVMWDGDFETDAGYAEIAKAIEMGYLTPVTNRFNEGLEEAVNQNDLMNAVQDAYGYNKKEAKEYIKSIDEKTKAELIRGFKDNAKKSLLTDSLEEDVDRNDYVAILEREAGPLVEMLDEIEGDGGECYITWNFGFNNNDEITCGLDIRMNPRFEGKEQKENEIKARVEEAFELCGFELDNDIKHTNPSKNIFGGWHYQIKKVDDVDADVELTTDDMNGGQWYESLRKTESLNEGRYSDYADDETRANGWWYFTTHGVGPGSIPKDLNVLEVKEGQNKKGTWGDYVRLDGILNTDELDYYDMIELAPTEEEEDFTGFFSDYDFDESLDEEKTPYGDTTIDDYVETNFDGDAENKSRLIADMKKKVNGKDYFNGLDMSVNDWEKAGKQFGLSMKRFPVTEGYKVDYISADLADKTNKSSIKNAYDRNELSIVSRDGVYWFEGCPERIRNTVFSEMKKFYPELKYLYDKSSVKKGIKEDFDVDWENNRKAKAEVVGWWKDVEKWNEENGSKFNIDNDYSDAEAMFTAIYDMLSELKTANKDLYKRGKAIYNKYAYVPIDESLKENNSDEWCVVDEDSGTVVDVFNSREEAEASARDSQEMRDNGMFVRCKGPFSVEPYSDFLTEDTIKTKDFPKDIVDNLKYLAYHRTKGMTKRQEYDLQDASDALEKGDFNTAYRIIDNIYHYVNKNLSSSVYNDLGDIFDAMKKFADSSLNEDTVKTSDGKWTNKGKEGTHGKFKTKKEADAQRRAMFANGFKG